MKLTKNKLRQIIKEEKQIALKDEQTMSEALDINTLKREWQKLKDYFAKKNNLQPVNYNEFDFKDAEGTVVVADKPPLPQEFEFADDEGTEIVVDKPPMPVVKGRRR